jgi:hypothetical protein
MDKQVSRHGVINRLSDFYDIFNDGTNSQQIRAVHQELVDLTDNP